MRGVFKRCQLHLSVSGSCSSSTSVFGAVRTRERVTPPDNKGVFEWETSQAEGRRLHCLVCNQDQRSCSRSGAALSATSAPLSSDHGQLGVGVVDADYGDGP